MKKLAMRWLGMAAAALLAGCALGQDGLLSVFNADKTVRAEGAEAGEWTQDTDAGFALAKEQGLPILANFTGSDWCYWCKLMDRRVFSSKAWAQWAGEKKAVLLWVDFPDKKDMVPKEQRRKNEELAKRFNVRGFPTYYVLAPDGETVWGRLGASQDATAAEFCGEVDACIARGGEE